jgi:NAD(P)-dependent dehydrogenase (short-subunit alcohol dehydrogenase family)
MYRVMYTYPKYDLEGKVAVVTGAGQGLGKWIALALADAGADVLVNALHSETAEKPAWRSELWGVARHLWRPMSPTWRRCRR